MISKEIIISMSDIDEKLLDDVLTDELPASEQKVIDLVAERQVAVSSGKAGRRSRKRLGRRSVAAIIAAALVFAFGVGAYAGGVLTAPIGIFRTRDTENTASEYIGTDDDGGMLPSDVGHTERYIDDDGNEQDLDFIDIASLVRSPGLDALNGPVKEEAPQMIWKLHKANYRAGSATGNTVVEYNGCVGSGINNYHKTFDTQKEALEYIGHRSLGEQYFPFDNCKTTVNVGGDYWWENKGKTELPDIPERFMLHSLELTTESAREDINVRLYTSIALSDSATPRLIGFFGLLDDGHNTTELFTTSAGYNGTKISSVYGKTSTCNISGYIVKDGCVCYIFINSSWQNRTQAEEIFNTWAESL